MSCVLCNCERCIHHDGDGCTLEHVDLDHGFCIDLETVISRTKEDQLSLLIARATLESQPILEVDGNVRPPDTARGVARARTISKKGVLEYVAENNKLRELVRKYGEFTDQDRCEGCVYKYRCIYGEIDECWQYTEIRELARELGVEVDG